MLSKNMDRLLPFTPSHFSLPHKLQHTSVKSTYFTHGFDCLSKSNTLNASGQILDFGLLCSLYRRPSTLTTMKKWLLWNQLHMGTTMEAEETLTRVNRCRYKLLRVFRLVNKFPDLNVVRPDLPKSRMTFDAIRRLM